MPCWVKILMCCLFTAGSVQAQTSTPVAERIIESPGSYAWTHDLQVILALVGVPQSQVRYDDWIRDLDPDFNDWSSTEHAEQLLPYGILTSVSAGAYQEIHPDEELVRRFTNDGICAFADGKIALGSIPWGPVYFMCHNNPGWHTYKKDWILSRLPQLRAINQDNIGVPWKGNIGFCEGCQRYFREFLRRRLSPEAIKTLGIADLSRFSMVEWLKEKHGGKMGNHLLADPVVRQYMLAMNVSQRDHWKDIVDAVHSAETNLGRPVPCTGNQQGGQEWDSPFQLLLSEVNDIVAFESDPWYYAYETPRPLTAGAKFKLALASGRFKKAAWVRGGLYDTNRKAEDGHTFRMRLYGQSFQDLAYGEAFANGGVRVFNLANEGAPPPEPDYETRLPFYNRFIDYARLIHQHRAALQDRNNAADVALVYSMPTQFWEQYGPLRIDMNDAFARYIGWARLLEEIHVPYEVIIFGHSELFPDGQMLERLPRYRAVILPGVTCMSEVQADAVRNYIQNGGSVVWSGTLATYDENRSQRPASLFKDFPRLNRQHTGKGRIIGIIDEDLQYREKILARETPSPTDFHVMREAILWALDGRPQVESTACPETQFNLWMADNQRSASLHLVNYRVDIMRDYVEPQFNVRVTVRLPDKLEPFDRVTLVAPGKPDTDLPFQKREGAVSFIVPELRVWAMVVFSSGREQEAAAALTGARKQIRKQAVARHTTGHWIERYERAFEQYRLRKYDQSLELAVRLAADAAPRLDEVKIP